jgi:hypothetical protein
MVSELLQVSNETRRVRLGAESQRPSRATWYVAGFLLFEGYSLRRKRSTAYAPLPKPPTRLPYRRALSVRNTIRATKELQGRKVANVSGLFGKTYESPSLLSTQQDVTRFSEPMPGVEALGPDEWAPRLRCWRRKTLGRSRPRPNRRAMAAGDALSAASPLTIDKGSTSTRRQTGRTLEGGS